MTLSELRETYWQEPDCCSTEEEHELMVKTMDGGGGHYLVLSTKRWSVDEDELPLLFDRLKNIIKRARYVVADEEKRKSKSES